MLRFRNPGTDIVTQISVFKQLYKHLSRFSSFGIKEMADVIANNNLLTAYGYAGNSALQLSNTEQESLNSARMNAKMYAEVFRMLGWVSPATNKSYPVRFTIIGRHIALAKGNSSKLVEQCVLGINNPTELSDKMSYTENVRFFKCALRFIIDMGGVIYKHELSLGPMSVNDNNEKEYQAMLSKIKSLRGNISTLKAAFSTLAQSLNMQEVPVDNCTRIPVAFLKICGFVESINDKTIYNKSLECLKITEYGREVYARIARMKDLRLGEFCQYENDTKYALVRIAIFQMLERSGYDISPVKEQLTKDISECSKILNGKDLLFSPCQTLRYEIIAAALGEDASSPSDSIDNYSQDNIVFISRNLPQLVRCKLDEHTAINEKYLHEEDYEFINKISLMSKRGLNPASIAKELFDSSVAFTQFQFYPFVAQLFRIIGFDCVHSRPGDNGARWDAIIRDAEHSVPIEIKSPTEELHISIKAMRQAVENKIVLLSRQTHATKPETTSMIVGYYLPNDRAEVSNLVTDYKEAYSIKVGIVGFYSLLLVAICVITENKCLEKDDLLKLEGMLDVEV